MKASLAIIVSGIVILQSCSFCWSNSEERTSLVEQLNWGNSALENDDTSREKPEILQPEIAECKLEIQRVPLPVEDGTSKMYLPPFLIIARCSGCCRDPLSSCRPWAKVTKNYEVMVNEMNDGNATSRKQIFPMEEHIGCKCDKKSDKTLSSEKRKTDTNNGSVVHGGYIGEVSLAETLAGVTGCRPELQTVFFRDFVDNPESHLLEIHPPCTKIRRCVGFCQEPPKSCLPATTRTRNYAVKVHRMDGIHEIINTNAIISLEEHTSCECGCSIDQLKKPCNSLQIFIPSACSCQCTNTEDEEFCHQSQFRVWDAERCECPCRVTACLHSSLRFNEETCFCARWA